MPPTPIAPTTTASSGGSCPPDDVLEILAAGGSTDAATRTHTDTCARCQSLLDELRSHAAFVAEYLEDIRPRATGLTGAGHPHAAAETELDVSPDLVPGYRILAPIHRGGQGVVYRALHEKTKRTVAIKMLLAGHFADARQRQRFEREAELAALLKHPNLVTIYDTLNLRGGRYAIVMEYIEGSPLDQWKPPGTNDRERIRSTIRLFVEICSGLQHAHSNAIIHRDLKPSNVLVDKEGRARIVDFGIARSLKPDDAAITHTGEFTGTRQFASPEQIGEAMGKPARSDARSDVYSLGVMLFAVLCARLPYDVGDSIFSSAEAILNAAPARPTSIRPTIGKDLETIILKALQKEPDRRYETAISLGRDLERYLDGDAIEARRDSTWYVIRKALRRNRVPLGIAAAVAIAATWVAVRESGLRRLADDNAAKAKKSAEEAKESALANKWIVNDKQVGDIRDIANSEAPARAEEEAWRYALNRLFDVNDPSSINPMRKPTALWSLREFHFKQRCLFTTDFPDRGPLAMSVDVSGQTVSIIDSAGCGVRLAIPSGRRVSIFQVPISKSVLRSISPNGRWLATLEDKDRRVTLFNLESGGSADATGIESSLDEPPLFTQDSRLALVDSSGRLLVLDPETMAPTVSPSHNAPIRAINASSSIITAVDDRAQVLFWDGRSSNWARTLDLSHLIVPAMSDQPGEPVSIDGLSATLSPDGARLAFVHGANVHIIDPTTSSPISVVRARTARPQVTFTHAHDRIFLTGRGSAIACFSTYDGKPIQSLLTHVGTASLIGISPDDHHAVTSDITGRVKFWDLGTDPWAERRSGHACAVLGLTFVDDYTLLSCAGDGRALLWNLTDQSPPRTLPIEHPTSSVRTLSAAAAHPSGNLLFTAGYDHLVRRFEIGSLGTPDSVDAGASVFSLSLDPSGKSLAAALGSGEVVVYDASTLKPVVRWKAHDQRVTTVTWDRDGSRLATASADRSVRIWNPKNGESIGNRLVHPMEARGVVFGEDGKFLYTACDDGAIRLASPKALHSDRRLHEDVIYAIAASPRNNILATGGRDGVFLCSAPYIGTLIHFDLPPEAAVFSLAFSPDGRRVAAGTQSGDIFVWDLERFDRAIAGNVDFQVTLQQRQKPKPGDPRIDEPTAAAARAWAAKVLASDSPVDPTISAPASPPPTRPVPPPSSSPAP